ncbi:MAG: 50S ribosomal protein L21e [Candidatus Ranarchaeia archaeon]
MGKNPRGLRHKTRTLFKKSSREQGLAPLSRIMHEYKIQERVDIIPDPSVHKTLPHRRFCGKVGVIVEKRGRAYLVKVKDGGKTKTIFLRKEHMRPSKQVG